MIRLWAKGGNEASRQCRKETHMQVNKAIITPILRRITMCAALLLCSCCLTSCSIIGSIIALPFRLLDAILG